MTRFQLLWERSDKAVENFKEMVKNGWRLRGAKMVRLREIEVIDKATGELVRSAYSVECVGTFISYLRNKLHSPRGVFIGWDVPKK